MFALCRNLIFLTLLLCVPALFAQNEDIEPVGPGTFSFAKREHKSIEGGTRKLKITRDGGSDGVASVRIRAIDRGAKGGLDYQAVDEVLTFADGETEKAYTLNISKDRSLELAETFEVTLSEPTGGATLGNLTSSVITIVIFGNDTIVIGFLMTLLALVFVTASSDSPRWKKFYRFVPSLLLCYFLPSILGTLGIISAEDSSLYYVSSRFLLPACLVLLCLSIDLKGIMGLGPKALIMFLTGTLGIVLGGPIAMLIVSIFSPETVGGEGANAVWRGLSTIAGSWIGGGANQTAMREVNHVGAQIFSAAVTVDIMVASLWMAVLLFLAGDSDKIDEKLQADNSAIKTLQKKITDYRAQISKLPTLTDLMKLLGVAFAITSGAHFFSDIIGPYIGDNYPKLKSYGLASTFFWMILAATSGGVALSFTKARELEGVGASRVGSAFLYVLVASIGMEMNLMAIFHQPGLFLVGAIWITFHGVLLFVVARLIKAPLFFLAVGSQANVGGAASAPIVASAFHSSLAPVGVMLAVLGYVLGTVAAFICGRLMFLVAS